MKTLFENLKEEHKKQLEVMQINYPHAHGSLVRELESNYLYSYLTISTAFTLLMQTTNKPLSFTNLAELFYE